MDDATRERIAEFVHENIDSFHEKRLEGIKTIKLNVLLSRKNPYLFKAKNINSAADFITAMLDARLSSSEEGSFGGFLESLAIFVAENTGGGVKSGVAGLDIELVRDDIRYLITVKSGRNWGNKDQRKAMKDAFTTALRILRQNRNIGQLQPVEGICYGKFGTGADRGRRDQGLFIQLIGQSFWELISGDENFYIDVIEPLGHEAEAHAANFEAERGAVHTRLTAEFTAAYCTADYRIDWPKLVEFVCSKTPPPRQPRQRKLPGA